MYIVYYVLGLYLRIVYLFTTPQYCIEVPPVFTHTKRYCFRRRTCFRSLEKDRVFHATHVSTRIFHVRVRIFRIREKTGGTKYNTGRSGIGIHAIRW